MATVRDGIGDDASASGDAHSGGGDERLAMLLDELIEQSRDGRVPNFDRVLADIPQADRDGVERELRSLWATAMIADDLAIGDPLADPLADPHAEPSRSGAALGSLSAIAGGRTTPSLAERPTAGDWPRDADAFEPGAFESEAFDHVDRPEWLGQTIGPLPRRMGGYELLEVIGRGGMGVVYKAREEPIGRVVAVKMILAGELATPEQLARFRREAEAAAKLRHPLIVPVYNVGELVDEAASDNASDNGGHDDDAPPTRHPFFSMLYVEGTTLAQRLASGPIRSREAAALLLRVCRAMAEAHKQGVLHRDLKPSNILLDRTGRPYITDFGLAAPVRAAGHLLTPDSLDGPPAPSETTLPDATHQALSAATGAGATETNAILGTPSYMAPEQALGAQGIVGPTTDVYALGGLLYAMLCGRPPFQAETPLDTVLMVLEQDPPRPRLLNPKADEDLEMIALKALQKPPDLRYASADALADDLDAYLQGNPILARDSSISQLLSRALRPTHHVDVLQNWGLLWMWHALALLVLCLITFGFERSGTTSRWPYLLLWTVGLGAWAAAFWQLRRRAGPVTFVERQVAHVWAGSMACVGMLYALEALLNLDVLKLSPVLALIAGTVFLIKAGILSGEFYIQAAVLYATSLAMAVVPEWGLVLFGVVSALCFAVPGYKFHRQRKRSVGEVAQGEIGAVERHLRELRPLRA